MRMTREERDTRFRNLLHNHLILPYEVENFIRALLRDLNSADSDFEQLYKASERGPKFD